MPVQLIEAEYEGKVLLPKEPLELPAGTRAQWSVYLPQQAADCLSKLRALWQSFEEHPVDAPSLVASGGGVAVGADGVTDSRAA